MRKLIIGIIAMLLSTFSITPEAAHAAFSLSVTPYEGGYDLRFGKAIFGKIRIDKEVRVAITSDSNKQYRVIQMLMMPLTNARGTSLPQNNFLVYGVRGTNKQGTMNIVQETPVFQGRTILYTSNQQGSADSFILAYSLKGPFSVPAGSYQGRITFTLEPVGSSEPPVTAVLNVYAEIESQSTIEITTHTGGKYIRLNSARPDGLTSDVLVSAQGNFGSQFRILQSLMQAPQSQTGETLAPEAVTLQVLDLKRGSGITQPSPLSLRQEAVYVSDSSGTQESFTIRYSLSEPQKQKAGKFRTTVKYLMEGQATYKPLESLDLEIEIERIFDLIITPSLGSAIEFRNLKPRVPPQSSEVLIEIRSNTGKPYQISQEVTSELVNKEGVTIPLRNFTVKEESVATKGTLKFLRPTELKMGSSTLFVSDHAGSADKFKVIYELDPPPDLKAGDYATHVTYSISEI